jgi:hypothetical protein
MTGLSEDETLIASATAYVIELYRELSQENGAPTPGTQNQAVAFILRDPQLRRAVAAWGRSAAIDEAVARPPRRLPQDDTYWRVAGFLREVMDEPVFLRAKRR